MRTRFAVPLVVALLGAVAPVVPAWADPSNTSTVAGSTSAKAVRVTPGRVWWADGSNVVHVSDADTSASPTALRGTYASYRVGTVTVGTSVNAVFSPSGNRLAYLDPAAAVIRVVDVSTGSAVTSSPSVTGLTSIKLSGSHLELDTPTAVLVRNLATGQQLSFPPSASLSGRYVAYFNPDGSIWRRDLVTGSMLQIRSNAQPEYCTKATVACTPANSPVSVKMRGSWVFWKYSCELRGVNLATNAATIDLSAPSGCLKKFSLLEGWLVYKDAAGVVQGQDLTAASTSPVAMTSNPVSGFSVEDRALSWYDANGVHVGAVELPGYAPTPRLSDAATPTAFSPNGDGRQDTWTPVFTVSGNITWTLTIKDSTSAVVASLTGTSPYGVIAPVWAPASTVPDGVYGWTLSDSTGALKGTDGGTGGLSGTVVVRRTALSGRVSAPLVSSSSATTVRLPLTLATSSTAGLPGYGPVAYTIQLLDNGVLRTVTSATAAPAILGTQGHTYRVRVQVLDNAGNLGAFSSYVTTAVPFDDRSTSLAYSTGWTSPARAGAFLGTLRASKTARTSVSLRTTLSRFAVVALACSTCGKVLVYVDGHLVTTVDTYAATTTLRKVVLLRTVATTAGLHTVKLVVAGTAGRPTVLLDAIAAIR